MLLTRSRLCPRPKPGSSLHLHVLGTPPAFVLSQDQTLREVNRTSTRTPLPGFREFVMTNVATPRTRGAAVLTEYCSDRHRIRQAGRCDGSNLDAHPEVRCV